MAEEPDLLSFAASGAVTEENTMHLSSRAALVLAVLVAACAARGPVIGRGDQPPDVGGTISGVVRASSDTTPLSGRKVTAVNLETGQRIEATTAVNGGYTMKVPLGRYRLEVELRSGEAVTEQPDEVHISTSDIDAGRDFAIAAKP
jgi:hypothetical protein